MSFIIQCLASKQSIPEGDPCRFLPIQHCARTVGSGTEGAPAYGLSNDPGPTGLWDAIGGFIPGTAEDCGRMQFSDEALAGLQSLFRSLYAHGRSAEGRLQDRLASVAPTFDKQIADRAAINAPASELRAMWDIVQKQLDDDNLFLPDYAAKWRPVAFAVVHEYAWEHLIEVGRKAQRKPVRIVEELAAILERDKDIVSNMGVPADLMRRLRASGAVGSLADTLSSISMTNGFPSMLKHAEAIQHAAVLSLDGAPHDKILATLQPVIDEALAMRGMDECNITIEPCRYAGQDYKNQSGRNFSDLVNHVSTRIAVDAHVNREAERPR